MNHSKILLPFFAISIFSLLFFSSYVYGSPVPNFQKLNEVCTETTTSTPINILNITDVTDFDFVVDEDYLLLVSAKFGGRSGVDQFILKLLHNNTIFQGSTMNYEVPQTNNSCGADDDLFNYFWFTLYTPNATEATQDINFEINSLANNQMQIDDVTIQVIHLSDALTKDTDYFFNEVLTTETLATGFATPNNATISFTPTVNNNDWMILGSNQIDTGSATINYESRIFFNGTEIDFPLMSEEGEDVSEELYVQTLSRFVTLTNSSQVIQMQSQIDEAGAGTHERTYSSIFALNLDKFREHTGQFLQPEVQLDDILFGDNILNQTHIVPLNNTDIFILADVGSKEFSSSNKFQARVQANNTDLLSGMTSETYEFNNERDDTDISRWTTPFILNVNASSHVIDIDGSETLVGQDGLI